MLSIYTPICVTTLSSLCKEGGPQGFFKPEQ